MSPNSVRWSSEIALVSHQSLDCGFACAQNALVICAPPGVLRLVEDVILALR